MTTITQRLAACYTGAVHDVLRMMGHENIVLPPAIKAIAPGTKSRGRCGPCPATSTAPRPDMKRCSAGARCSRRRPRAT